MDKRLQLLLELKDKITAPLRGIAAGSGDAAKAIKAARDRIKGLQAAQKDVTAFGAARKELAQTSAAMRAAQERVRQLAQTYAKLGPPTKAAHAEMHQAIAVATQLGDKFKTQRQNVHTLRERLSAAGVSTRNLSNDNRRLAADITATTAKIDAQKKAAAKLGELQNKHSHAMMLGAGMVAGGVGLKAMGESTARNLGQFLSPGAQFDTQMSKVQALTRLEKQSADYAMLRAQALELGATTMFSATQAAQGQAFLAMAGFDPKAIKAAMPGLLDMAKAGDMELGRTADIASNILSAFGIDPADMGRVADVLTKTFTTSNVNLEMLGNTMSYVGPVARAAGVDLEKTAAMAGLLGNVGIQSEKAGTAMRAMLLRLSAPTKGAEKALKKLNLSADDVGSLGKARKAVQQLGVQTMDAQGNMRPLLDIMDDLAKATKAMGSAKRMEFLKTVFGEEPAAAMTELMEKAGDGGIKEYLEKVKDSAGAAKATAATMADNITGDIDELSSAWEDVRIQIFDANNGEIRAWVQKLTRGVQAVGEWFKAHPLASQWLVRIVAGFALLTAVLGALLIPLGLLMAKTMLVRLVLARLALNLSTARLAAQTAAPAVGLLGRTLAGLPQAASAAARAVPAALKRIGLAIQAPARGGLGLWQKLRQRMAVPAGQPGLWKRLGQTIASLPDKGRAAWDGLTANIKAAGKATGQNYQRLKAYIALQKAAAIGAARRGVAAMVLRGPGGLAKDAAGGLASLAGKGIAGTINGIKVAFLGLWRVIAVVGRLLFLNPIGLAVMAIATAALLIIKYWQPIKAFFTGFWQGFTQGLAPLSGMFSGVFGGLGAMLAPLRPVWDWLVGAFAAAWGWVSRLFAPIQATRQSLDGATQAGQGFGAWLAGLVVTVAQLVGQFFSFGANIVRGLIDGMLSVVGAVVDTVKGIASKIKGVFTGDMQIKSPSRVFMQYGGFIGQGAAIGMEKALPAVSTAALALAGAAALPMQAQALQVPAPLPMQAQALQMPALPIPAPVPVAMAAPQLPVLPALPAPAPVPVAMAAPQLPVLPTFPAPAPVPVAMAAPQLPVLPGIDVGGPAVQIDRRAPIAAAAAPRAAPVVQGDTITIHVHAAPGMDAQALARAVSAELDRRNAAKAARLHSSFIDFNG